jgi:D-sedoheptulose 7-phosphate isomerase
MNDDLDAHVQRLMDALTDVRLQQTAARWGNRLARLLPAGARLLVAGNGGSAAQAQHLTAEIVGRYDRDRPAFSAIALHAETSSLTAIGNDYGHEEIFARQVEAHGRPGDICLLLSTSGRSPNVVTAAERARERGLEVWAMTGPPCSPMTELADALLWVDAPSTATVQEVHLVALHLVCEAMDLALLGAAEDSAIGRAPLRAVAR